MFLELQRNFVDPHDSGNFSVILQNILKKNQSETSESKYVSPEIYNQQRDLVILEAFL